MKNGSYLIKHNLLDVRYKLVVKNGVYCLYSFGVNSGSKFIKTTTKEILAKHCSVIKEMPTIPAKYDLHYYLGGKVNEIIRLGTTYGICKWRAQELKKTTHRYGKFLIIKSEK